jgi:hypothetical protein
MTRGPGGERGEEDDCYLQQHVDDAPHPSNHTHARQRLKGNKPNNQESSMHVYYWII